MATSLKTPFRIDNGRVGVTRDQTTAIKQKIVDVLVTDRYERAMRPEYGGGINSAVFENIDSLEATDYKLDLATSISQAVTGVTVTSIDWTIDGAYATINVSYKLPLSTDQQFTFRLAIPGEVTEETPLQ